MSTRSQQFALAADGNFQQRCLASGMAYSIATVIPESHAGSPGAERYALSQQVFLFPDSWKYRLALACVMVNANLQNAAPNDGSAQDADINAAIAAVWTEMSRALLAAQTFKVI